MPAPPPEALSPSPPASLPVRLGAALSIPRPVNGALTFGSVLLGGWLGPGRLSSPILLAGLSAAAIAGGANVVNDLRDLRVDRISHPDRPLPSGRLSVPWARALAAALTVAGLALSLPLPAPCRALAAGSALLLLIYNLLLKRLPLVGNLAVAGLGGLTFLYGGFAAQAPLPALLPAGFASLYHLGREIVKDVQDRSSDRTEGRTLATELGSHSALRLATLVFLIVVVITPVPAFAGSQGGVYLAVVLGLDALLLYVLRVIWTAESEARFGRASRILKGGMVLGIAAFFLDRLAAG